MTRTSGERFLTVTFSSTRSVSGERFLGAVYSSVRSVSGERALTVTFPPPRSTSGERFLASVFTPNRFISGERFLGASFAPGRTLSGERYLVWHFNEPFDGTQVGRMRIPIKWLMQLFQFESITSQTADFTAVANRGCYRIFSASSVTMTLPATPRENDVVGVVAIGTTSGQNSGTVKYYVAPNAAHNIRSRQGFFTSTNKMQLATHGNAEGVFYLFQYDSTILGWRCIHTTELQGAYNVSITDATAASFECDPWGSYQVSLTVSASIKLPPVVNVGENEIEFISVSPTGSLTINAAAAWS